MEEFNLRFYIKVVDKENKPTTYRFLNEKTLIDFIKNSHNHQLAIVDSHMAFYGENLLSPTFGLNVGDIDHMDINLAKEWLVDDGQEIKENAIQPILLDNKKAKSDKQTKKDKAKKDKVKKLTKKSKKLNKKTSKKNKKKLK